MPREDALFQRSVSGDYPVLVRGEGIYLYDEAGNRYIDGVAGASNVTLGHGRERIADAMADQAKTLAYCFSVHFTNRLALEFAERVAALAPGDLDHAYFVSGGSEAIETAIKIARQVHLQRGNAQKYRIISRWWSYHGATLGALAATGIPSSRAPFAPMLPDTPHISPCYPYRCRFEGCDGRCNLTCARELEKAILQAGPETVAAFIAEPVVLGGMAVGVPPPDYFPMIREICDRYDVLFIADEIITGFGRTGTYFAMEHWHVVPDMIAFGKGVSSGYIPLGGVVLRRGIRDSFAASGRDFVHIFTYVNNPVAMRVGMTVLDIIKEENVLDHVRRVGDHLRTRAEVLRRHSIVGQIRSIGLMLGIELVRDQRTKEPFPASLGLSRRLAKMLMDEGLSISAVGGAVDGVNGDDLRFYPPLIITPDQIDECIDIIDSVLTRAENEYV